MHQIVISPLNAYDDGKYFNGWLTENYNTATGIIPDYVANTLTINFSDTITPATESAIVAFYHGIDETAVLPTLKIQKNYEIDIRTQELIAEGVTFNTNLFSLSSNAQRNWIGIPTSFNGNMHVTRKGTPSLTHEQAYDAIQSSMFPLAVTTKDDLEYEFQTYSEFMDFYNTALTIVKTHYMSGRAYKEQINNATTVLELDAIVDTR